MKRELQYYDDSKFEYRLETFVNIKITELSDKLNKLGDDGWELVTIDVLPFNTKKVYIFKRRLHSIIDEVE